MSEKEYRNDCATCLILSTGTCSKLNEMFEQDETEFVIDCDMKKDVERTVQFYTGYVPRKRKR